MRDPLTALLPEALRRPGRGNGFIWVGVVGTWLALVLWGMFVLQRYGSTPASLDTAPSRWPAASRVVRAPQRPDLVMLAHPYCPCTRASLAELSRLVTRLPHRMGVHVLFIHPEGVEAGWENTDLVARAREIPGAMVDLDEEGREAGLFGVRTSGEAVLYGEDGRLLFHGGITPSRGHEGDNVGFQRIVSLLTTGGTDRAESAVFGCGLFDDASLRDR
jgi:hypothetical protein